MSQGVFGYKNYQQKLEWNAKNINYTYFENVFFRFFEEESIKLAPFWLLSINFDGGVFGSEGNEDVSENSILKNREQINSKNLTSKKNTVIIKIEFSLKNHYIYNQSITSIKLTHIK